MGSKTDKNILKQYFRSGSRPTQKQFYELIDSCYNEEYTSFISGYQLEVNIEPDKTIYMLTREAGKTTLTPFFPRINTIHQRFYHFSIPISNIGSGFFLEKIVLELRLPESTHYSVKDQGRELKINQKVKVDFIKVYNGTDEIFAHSPGAQNWDPIQELKINESAEQWKGIAIDIAIVYDIKSDIAVSDQFKITGGNNQMLKHTFGGVGCIFKPFE